MKRCRRRGLLSRRSTLSVYVLISVNLGSPLGKLPLLLSEGARDGASLTVENL